MRGLSMITGNSPGIYIKENNLAESPKTQIYHRGAIVGQFASGPINQRFLTDSKGLSVFGDIDEKRFGYAHLSARVFLDIGDNCYITRLAPNARFAGCMIRFDGKFNSSISITEGIENSLIEEINEGTASYPFTDKDLFLIMPKYASDTTPYYIRVYPDTINLDSNYFYVDVVESGSNIPAESFRVHMAQKLVSGVQYNVADKINNQSSLITVIQNLNNPDFIQNPDFRFINTYDAGNGDVPGIEMLGGYSGDAPTEDDIIEAWQNLYSDKDQCSIDLLINAGYTEKRIQDTLIDICETRMDCIALLDVPLDYQTNAQSIISYRRTVQEIDNKYGVLIVSSPLYLDRSRDLQLYIPCSGALAATIAFSDKASNNCPWYSPGNDTRGQTSPNVLGFKLEFDRDKMDALTSNNICYYKTYDTTGIRLTETLTLTKQDSPEKNLSVVRMQCYLNRRLTQTLDWSLFDPNDENTRVRIRNSIDGILGYVQSNHGITEYVVVCDESNNTEDTIMRGDLYVDINYIATMPVRQIIMRVTLNRITQATFNSIQVYSFQ